jgi:hypothetical protein
LAPAPARASDAAACDAAEAAVVVVVAVATAPAGSVVVVVVVAAVGVVTGVGVAVVVVVVVCGAAVVVVVVGAAVVVVVAPGATVQAGGIALDPLDGWRKLSVHCANQLVAPAGVGMVRVNTPLGAAATTAVETCPPLAFKNVNVTELLKSFVNVMCVASAHATEAAWANAVPGMASVAAAAAIPTSNRVLILPRELMRAPYFGVRPVGPDATT